MALLGGGVGGAGNPVGGSFTGPSLLMEYVLDRCYCYSGAVQAATSNQTLMEFRTGNKLIVGFITCVGGIENNGGGVAGGTTTAFTLTFNGGDVARFKSMTDGTSVDNPVEATYPIIIPPYTEVKLVVFSTSTTGMTTALITGQTFQTAD